MRRISLALLVLLAVSNADAWTYVDSGQDEGRLSILAAISSDTGVMAESLTRQKTEPADAARILILRELKSLEASNRGAIMGSPLHHETELVIFYRSRNYRPAWLVLTGLSPKAYALARILKDSGKEGLDPRDYHLDRLRILTDRMLDYWRGMKAPPPEVWIQMELLLTDGYFTYASHQRSGRLGNPDAAAIKARKPDLPRQLERALNASSFREELSALAPRHVGYILLRDALARYRKMAEAGGWPSVPLGRSLRKGDSGPRVQALRSRLMITGELKEQAGDAGEKFNENMEEAVKVFQRSHGLEDDGVVGRGTLAELNVPVTGRITQILANLERWRWLPEDMGERYLMVNIAGFWLDVVENGEVVMSMEAIVGKDYAQTPMFSGLITYLVLGPSWTVPRTIAVRDKLPLILSDPLYLGTHGYKVIKGWGGSAVEVDPATVDWSKLDEDNFPYLLKQGPGPDNALGRIKFMFPNSFDVYIHDTPEKWLFNKSRRTFSSGCIRISKPIELAEYLLSEAPHWSRNAILRTIIKWSEQSVRLPHPIPIHILYFTAWVDEDGGLQFREDIYGRDQALLDAMAGIDD